MKDAHIEQTDVLYYFASGLQHVGDILAGDAQRMVSDCDLMMTEFESTLARIQQRYDDAESECNAIENEISNYGNGPEDANPEDVEQTQKEMHDRLKEAQNTARVRLEAYQEAQRINQEAYSQLLTMQAEFNKFAGEIQSRSNKVSDHVTKVAQLIDNAYKSRQL